MSVAFAGMTGGAPRAPYAYSGLSSNTAFSPTDIVATPTSQPLITCPAPNLNTKCFPRSLLESN